MSDLTSPPDRRPAGRKRLLWIAAAIATPIALLAAVNIALLETRRQTFLSTCRQQAGIHHLEPSGDWRRVAAPDCRNAREDWQCSLAYAGPQLDVPSDLLPFRFSEGDDFGFLWLSAVPRVTYARAAGGDLFRITNFAFANLNQWDFLVPVYPTQSLCFFPLISPAAAQR